MNESVWIALLRGINVGGKVLKMADLKEAIADMGFHNAATYLQSGNLVFRAPVQSGNDLAPTIAGAIEIRQHMKVHVIVRALAEWEKMIDDNPFPDAVSNPRMLHAFVMDRQPDPSLVADLRSREFSDEQWEIVGDTVYFYKPADFGRSELAKRIEKLLKVPMTARNWNTVMAIAKLAKSI